MYLTSGSFTVAQWNNGSTINHLGSTFCWQSKSKTINQSVYSNLEHGERHQSTTHEVVKNNHRYLTEARLIITFDKE